MANPNSASDLFDDFADGVIRAFSDITDFFWKSPSLIETQEKIELEKLRDYYSPEASVTRDLRWQGESRKLYHVFPFLLATGNLFTIVSLFEVHLLYLAKLVENHHTAMLSQTQAEQGVRKVLKYLRQVGADPSQLVLWPQVDAALKIRNCFMHASGLLAWAREEQELRRIVQSRTYYSREQRQKNKKKSLIVAIAETPLGDRIQITNEYPWWLTIYFRDYLVELCTLGKAVIVQSGGQ